ncbi:MAG TPA: glycosyltransferase, partial [Acidimicrobiales bacterium]|nr:glycosyltransferase [Acidimicrobiales bacterium]
MSKYLFVVWEGGGNVPPQLGIVRRLVERKHQVRVLADPCLKADIESVGAEMVSFSRAPHRLDRSPASDFVRDWEARTPIGEFARTRDRAMIGPAGEYAADVLAEIDRDRPDALVADWLLFGAALAGEAARVPTAMICHNPYMVPGPGKPAPGLGFGPRNGPTGRLRDSLGNWLFVTMFNKALPKLNKAREGLGLPPLGSVPDLFDHVQRVLVLTEAGFDLSPSQPASNVVYVGPVLDPPAGIEPWSSPWSGRDPRPLVLVTTSSFYQDPRKMLTTACSAIRSLGARGLVTTGAIDPSTLPVGEDIVAVRTAPHDAVLDETRAVITHCGLGTVHRALIKGVPILCQPIGRDQPDVAARVVAAGAGLRTSPNASAARVSRALRRLLDEATFADRAARV